ncbi:WYL domain-containing protein [Xanthomonas campestris]|uniref:WYL domain-containing protein n=2 Tax=Xanthomonas campestris TaxID=339 RepID=UPI001C861390|nr:WYL domain-containing protein [Xanthomonas campestris]MCC5051264.1 WYL domain-containing protein [Xanthomonas campestris pv. aberrans]MEB1125960.1 WYL domain-containing protein [Xanthomonas campestris pv. campestris]
MSQAPSTKPWSVEQRLEFIEFMMFWEGNLKRADIVGHFGVSPQQASGDLSAYQELAPDNLRYDLRAKRYVATPDFACRLIRPDADRYLRELTGLTTKTAHEGTTWLAGTLEADVIPALARRVDPTILRQLLATIRAKCSVDVEYLSLNSDATEQAWRTITPHAFGSDGARWHVRAFCHKDRKFKDFLLSRCTGIGQKGELGQGGNEDVDWNEFFSAVIVSNPDLSPTQRKVIEHDYGMDNSKVILKIRYALLYYFDKRFGADFAPSKLRKQSGDPRSNPIIISNLEQYKNALRRVGVSVSDMDANS